jgi:hypothetical protein
MGGVFCDRDASQGADRSERPGDDGLHPVTELQGPPLRHMRAVKSTRWDRLVRRLTGRWPERLVERRWLAMERDQAEWTRELDRRFS